jgi:DNA-binding MarR family transcriptional regulator
MNFADRDRAPDGDRTSVRPGSSGGSPDAGVRPDTGSPPGDSGTGGSGPAILEPDPAAPSPEPAVETSVPFRSVGFTVSSIGYAVAKRFRETLAPLELEPREFAVLRAVAAAEGQSQQAIGDRLQIPPSRMVAFVDALEARSLLERRHNPHDRRTRELHLTEAGRELLERAFALAAGLERDLCSGFSDSEREQLLALLQSVGLQVGLSPGVHAAHAHSALAEE